MMRSRPRRSRGFHSRSNVAAELQQLEPRSLPTGTVLASVTGGNLTITGDNLDNWIVIGVFEDGVFLSGVTGEDTATDTKIKFNNTVHGAGETVQLLETPNLKNLTILMRGGNDKVFIAVGDPDADPEAEPLSVAITGRVRINLGQGNDHGVLGVVNASLNITGNLEGDLEGGNDCLVIGSGVDSVKEETELRDPLPIHVGGQAILLGRLGDDLITLAGAEVQRGVTINGDDGADSIALVGSEIHGNLSINGNKGDDDLVLGLVLVGGTTSVRGDAGNDRVVIGAVESSKNVLVLLGAGEDQLAVSALTVDDETDRITFDGGAGTDSLQSAEEVTDPPVKLKSIENDAAEIDADLILDAVGMLATECIDATSPPEI